MLMLFTADHRAIQDALRKFIDTEINPHVDEWERAESFLRTTCLRKWVSWAF